VSVVHHIAISVDDLERAAKLYGPMILTLGGRAEHESDRLRVWRLEDFLLVVHRSEHPDGPHTFGTCGWQHAALMTSRDLVDQCTAAVRAAGARIVHEPREYPEYWDGYYAVFFEDSEGIRWEVLHPGDGPPEEGG
jgi:catechol 2,3-dioxygenase-like lactoylglutathione lyase family enzyme